MSVNKKKKTKPIQFQIGWPGLIAIVLTSFCAFLWTFVLGFWVGQKVVTGNCPQEKVEVFKPAKTTSEGVISTPNTIENTKELYAKKELESLREEILKEDAIDKESSENDVIGPKNKGEIIEEKIGQEQKEEPLKKTSVQKEENKEKSAKKEEKIQVKGQEKNKIEHKDVKKEVIKTEKKAKKQEKELKRYFALQIASYKRIEHAKREAKRWEEKGYFVKIQKANLGRKGIWYRVYIGKYKSLKEAKKASVKLASKEGIRSYVASFGK